MALVLFPFGVFATEKVDISKYTSMNLEETLKAENITADLSNYKENDQQITIYMFRGQGCSHCQDFLKYVAETLVSKYKDRIKLVSFETWYDKNNSQLLNTVASFLGDQAGGVPYIIIGEKTFLGYAESLNSQIESAIEEAYNSKERYDVFKEINKEEKENNKGSSNSKIIIGNIIVTAIGVLIIVVHNAYMKKEILNEIRKKNTKNTK